MLCVKKIKIKIVDNKRHPCVTKNANVRNECSKISALWVEGNLEIALTEVKFGKNC